MLAKMITIIIPERVNLKLSHRFALKTAGTISFSELVVGNLEISKLFECLVILKTEKGLTGKKDKGVHHTTCMGSLFSPLPDVTVLMLLTDFVQSTALNHWRWCCMEDGRCGRHVLDH